jgi:hypothetical protein
MPTPRSVDDGDTAPGSRPGGAGPWRYPTAGGLYLLLAVGLWWHVWSTSPSTVMTCDCTDAGRVVWYLEWSAFALSHGHQLLFSTWLFHPVGLNLLADTSVPAIGLALSPVTLLAGPVTAMNVASTLIPALTALSMFWLLQRWVRWTPAAFVGGLAYGFSAMVIVQLAFGWLNLACLALVPLMVGCFDELYIRQRMRPARVGVLLAALMAVEFFISTEMVLVVCVSAALATVVLAGYAWWFDRLGFRPRARRAVAGLGVAGTVTVVLLGYPLWLFLAGPAHLSGMLWSTNVPGDLGNVVSNLWSHLGRWGPLTSPQLAGEARVFGGYRGPVLPSPSYLGPGLLVVLAAGTVVWRRDRRLWFFALLGVLTAALSLRVTGATWGPWSIVYHLRFFDDVTQSRFDAIFVLCAAVMLAIIIDRSRSVTWTWFVHRHEHHRSGTVPRWFSASRWKAAAVAAAVSSVAVVPVIAVLGPNLPLKVQPVTVPRWFTVTAEQLRPGQVLLTYPFATADSQAPIPWQAIGAMHFQMAGGGGPAGTVARAGLDKLAFDVLNRASVPLGPAPVASVENLEAVRQAMRNWGVTMVVVPDDTGLPAFLTGRGTDFGVAFFTAVLGSAPVRQDHAWVWSDLSSRPPVVTPPSLFSACVARAQRSSAADPWAPCILQAGAARPAASDFDDGVVR